jgi:alpha-1,2-mannosyltransferase
MAAKPAGDGASSGPFAPMVSIAERIGSFLAGIGRDLKYAAWFTRRRALAYAGFLLVFEVAAFLLFAAVQRDYIVKLERPTASDFTSFYAAGALADAGVPALAYDRPAHLAAEERATKPGIKYIYFYYPPIFLAVCMAFAVAPYLASFVIFETTTLLGYLMIVRTIARERGWASLVPMLAFPAVPWTLGIGQNSFLSAAIFGGATLLVDSRPVSAGLLFGTLAYKPQLALLVPVALAAARNWRAFWAAAAAALVLSAASLALFGTETWRSFLVAFAGSSTAYESAIDRGAMVNGFGAVLILGGSPALAYAVQAVVTVAAAFLVAFVWRRRTSLAVRGAALAGAVLLAAPLALFYDFTIAFVAMAWLVRLGRDEGFMPWDKTVLMGTFIAPLASRYIGREHVPIATVALVALLVIVVRHARRQVASRDLGAVAAAGRSLSIQA